MEIDISISRRRNVSDSADCIEDLAHRIAAGDTDAWRSFFDRYAPWTYRFAYYHLNCNHADAEDLCSIIMIAAARSIGKFNSKKGSLDAWMFGLARKRLAQFCRDRRMHFPLIPDVSDQSSATETTHVYNVDDALLKDVVNRAISVLPERQASVLIAKYVDGYSTDELAEIMGSTNKAVESLLGRARIAFRSAFDRLAVDGLEGE